MAEVLRQLTHDVTRADGVWYREGELRVVLRTLREGCVATASTAGASASEVQAVRAWLVRLVAHIDGSDAQACTAALRLLSISVGQLSEDHAAWAGEQVPARVLRVLKAGTPTQRAAAMQCGARLVERLTAQGKQGPLKKILATSAFIPSMVALLVPVLVLDPRLAHIVTVTLKRVMAAAPAAMAQRSDALRQVVPELLWSARTGMSHCGAELLAALPWMDASGAAWAASLQQCFASLAVLATQWINDGGPVAEDAAPDTLLAGLPRDSSMVAFGSVCDAAACLLRNVPPAAASVSLATHTAMAHFARVLTCATHRPVGVTIAWLLLRQTLPVLSAYVRLGRASLLLHHSALMEALRAALGWALAACVPAARALCDFYCLDYAPFVPVGHAEAPLFGAVLATVVDVTDAAPLIALLQNRPGLWTAAAPATRSAIEASLCARLVRGDAAAVAVASVLLQSSAAPQSGRSALLLREVRPLPPQAEASSRSAQLTASASVALAMRPPAPQWPGAGGSDYAEGDARREAVSVFANMGVGNVVAASAPPPMAGALHSAADGAEAVSQSLKRVAPPSPRHEPAAASPAKVHKADEWPSALGDGDSRKDNVDDADDGDDDDDGDAGMIQIVNEASSE